MSYLPYRDNPDLATVDPVDRVALVGLAEHIDASAQRALHVDQCACDRGEDCPHYPHGYQAHAEEALGWLVGAGLLAPAAVLGWLKKHQTPTPVQVGIPTWSLAEYLRKAKDAARPGVAERARCGEFLAGDVVVANQGSELRPIHVPGVIVSLVDAEHVLIRGAVGDIYDTQLGKLRHARVVSDTACELYGAAPNITVNTTPGGEQ